VELVDGTNLGRGRGKRMERRHDGRRESRQGHTTCARGGDGGACNAQVSGRCRRGQGGAGEDGVLLASGGAQRIE
jgi:hypothetical protein